MGEVGTTQAREMENDRKDQPHTMDQFPIFIRMLIGKSICIQVWDITSIKEVKSLFGSIEHIPLEEAVLCFEGKVLKYTYRISKYNIRRNSTIFLSLRLRGGVAGKGAPSFSKPSFREVVDKRPILV